MLHQRRMLSSRKSVPTKFTEMADKPFLSIQVYFVPRSSKYLYSNHTETIIKCFITNLNNPKTQK